MVPIVKLTAFLGREEVIAPAFDDDEPSIHEFWRTCWLLQVTVVAGPWVPGREWSQSFAAGKTAVVEPGDPGIHAGTGDGR